jgi:hypothetical protein
MKKSDIHQPPCYFDKYINQVEDLELTQAFQESKIELEELKVENLDRIGNAVYAAGKWTIKDIFQHLIDVEYILTYRALRLARNDKTQLSGFDEAVLAANVNTINRNLESLIAELKSIRNATTLLFGSFDDTALQHSGIISNNQMSALAFGFTIVGHQKHHLKFIEEKYLPLANSI